jgi:putative peptidoglycan lipid II flippase
MMPVIGFHGGRAGHHGFGWVMVWLLWRVARGMGEAAGRGAVCASLVLGPALVMPTVRYLALAALVGVGIVAYFASGGCCGISLPISGAAASA